MSEKERHKDDNFEQIEHALTSTEQFIEKNRHYLMYGAIGLLIVAGSIFGYNKLYKKPLNDKAITEIAGAQSYFARDSFNLALNGDGNIKGFLTIIEEFGSTKVGNLSRYYAGVCYLYLGDNDNAISYLKSFSTNDLILSSMSTSNIGDAYMQKGEYKNAAENYLKASKINPNEFSTPLILMKAALAAEKSKNIKAALAAYERIQKEFPKSIEARDIEKYIERSKMELK